MECFSGAQDINNFRENVLHNLSACGDNLTFNGIISEYFFDYGQKETQEILNFKLFQSNFNNPLNSQKESYVGLAFQSKFDGNGIKEHGRPPAAIVICLDISGSMGSPMNQNEKTKIEVAKGVLKTLVKTLKKDDYIAIVLFESTASTLFELQKVENINIEEFEKKIDTIKDLGGTNMESGWVLSKSLLEAEMKGYNKRIFFLTDAQPNINSTSGDGLLALALNAAEKKIYTTFFGVGLDFQASLVETISKCPGSQYFSIKSEESFSKLIIDDLDYMVFPIAFGVEVECDLVIDSVYGAPDTPAEEKTKKIFLNTSFPSNDDEIGEKGGLILLRFENKPETVNLHLKYTDFDGIERQVSNGITFESREETLHSSTSMQKGIALVNYVRSFKQIIASNGSSDKITPETLENLQVLERYLSKEHESLKDKKLLEEIEVIQNLIKKAKEQE